MDFTQNLRRKLNGLPKEKVLDFVDLLLKDIWTLQNNYMYTLEERFGHDTAVEFDSLCLGRMSEAHAYRLKKLLSLGDDIPALLTLLEYYPVEPGLEGQCLQVSDTKVIYRVTRCAMQLARRARGAPELPCKGALKPVMEKAFKVINSKFSVVRDMAPPDPHPDDLWCELEIELMR